MLINAQKTGQLIRRLFDGSDKTLIGELLQNAQRAGASRIDFNFGTDHFTISDNGSGLCVVPDPTVGFNALLRVAESLYTDPEVQTNQRPMGVGINALLGNEAVQTVTFRSNGYRVKLNLDAWWQVIDETNTWTQLIEPDPTPCDGFTIEVRCTSKLVESIQKSLTKFEPNIAVYTLNLGPCQGYAGLLDIYHNGNSLKQQSQEPTIPAACLQFSRVYQECPVTFYLTHHCGDYGRVLVNWYGQLILVNNHKFGNLGVIMRVAEGSPVNPKAPTRDGLIEDAALQAWRQWIEDELFAAVQAKTIPVTVYVLKALHSINSQRFNTECAYFIAQKVYAYEGGTYDDRDYCEEVFRYDAPPQLITEFLRISVPDSFEVSPYSTWTEAENGQIESVEGIKSFVDSVGEPLYHLEIGNSEKLSMGTIHWKCGDKIEDASAETNLPFYQPGEWRMEYPNQVHSDWHPIKEPVFVFADAYSSFDEIEWIFGTTDPIRCLEEVAWSAYSSPDEDADTARELYEEDVDATIRCMMHNAVPERYNQFILESHVRRWKKSKSARVTGVQFHPDKLLIDIIDADLTEQIEARTYGR